MKTKAIAFITVTPLVSGRFERGTHNGYVAVPPTNKYHGKHWNFEDIEKLDVHGGITFSDPVITPDIRYGLRVNPKYAGKRSPILKDAEYITAKKNIPDDWWILGFDTCHFGDNPGTWNRKAVIEETLRLMEQLTKED